MTVIKSELLRAMTMPLYFFAGHQQHAGKLQGEGDLLKLAKLYSKKQQLSDRWLHGHTDR